jgi:DNA-binding beta-propeller fold protein YncE
MLVDDTTSSRTSRRPAACVPLLAAVLAGLFAPAAAQADVKRRLYIPSPTGVAGRVPGSNLPRGSYASETPVELAFSRDGQTMYGVTADGDLNVYDLNGSSPPTIHALGLTDPLSIALTPDGTKAYVARNGTGTAIVDLTTFTTSALVTSANRLANSPDGTYLYANEGTNLVRILAADETIQGFIPHNQNGVRGLAVSPDGQRAVIAGSDSGNAFLLVFDLQTFTQEGSPILFTGDLRSVVVTPDSTTALVADANGEVHQEGPTFASRS